MAITLEAFEYFDNFRTQIDTDYRLAKYQFSLPEAKQMPKEKKECKNVEMVVGLQPYGIIWYH